MHVRALLRDDVGAGFPRDYVFSRLHGRHASLASARPTTAATFATDEEIWNAFLSELNWLFRQMNARMRVDYSPLFALFEIKTMVLCLRAAALPRVEPRGQLLERSVLSSRLREILMMPRPLGELVASLGAELSAVAPDFNRLDGRYFESGLRGCEDALMRLLLESMRGAQLVPAVRHFVTRFTDVRNLMAIYKHLHWDLKGPVALIDGGALDLASLKRMVLGEDTDALEAAVISVTGHRITATNELSLETILLSSLTRDLARARRRGEAWVVPHFIWQQYVHARNLAVRLHSASLDRATLERELIA
ncbi:MAG TPA: hypothetical protein VF491_03050 [Vicinamibacterales bacterium]